MKILAKTVDEYIANVPEERKEAFCKLRETILNNLPDGFAETISYGMIGYVVPHSVYPDGYHCNPEEPLPFMSLASQKNHIGLYHMGIYADEKLKDWFLGEYPKFVKRKLDMSKSCIRFKKWDEIPFDLIADLVSKVSSEDYIKRYEETMKKIIIEYYCYLKNQTDEQNKPNSKGSN